MESINKSFLDAIERTLNHYSAFHASLRDVVNQYEGAYSQGIPKSGFIQDLTGRGRYHKSLIIEEMSRAFNDTVNVSTFQRMVNLTGNSIHGASFARLQGFLSQRLILGKENVEAQLRRDTGIAYDAYHRKKLEQAIDVEYTYRDTIGRIRSADKYIQVEVMSMLYDGWNTSMVYLLEERGDKEAVIDRPGHKSDGERFAIKDYEELREELFHPQSNALVMPASAV